MSAGWDSTGATDGFMPPIILNSSMNSRLRLIEKGKAYVDDLTAEQVRAYRGTLTEPGRESPYRTRSVEENLDLFTRMRAGNSPTAPGPSGPRSTWPPPT